MNLRLVAGAYAVFALVAPGRLPTLCPYRRLTGHRCPFCGLTSAVGAALHGHVRRATTLHPLGLPVAVGLGVAAAWPRRLRRPHAPAPKVPATRASRTPRSMPWTGR